MATNNESGVDWMVALLIGGVATILILFGAIDTVADALRNLLVRGGVSADVAGNVGALVFGGIVLLFAWVTIKAYAPGGSES